MKEIVKFIKQTFNTNEFIPLHEPKFVGNEKNYLNDSLDGKAKQWYPNANLMLESAYKNGKYDGEWISYNERSFVISKAKFNNGNGMMESYDIRGNKVLESNFENNLKHGINSSHLFQFVVGHN